MEQQSLVIHPLAAEWEKVRSELKHSSELHSMLRLMFFLGAHRAVNHIVRSVNKTTATTLLRMELHDYEREVLGNKDAA